jgi:hypothetical protein
MKCFSLVVALAYVANATAFKNVTSLTPDNYEELTTGKTVFILFFATWVSDWMFFIHNLNDNKE